MHELGDVGKIWAILLIIFGVTGIGALLRTINEEFIQSKLFWNKKMMKNISKLKNHYIICGYGRMGGCQMSILLHKPYLVKWSIKEDGVGSKISQNLFTWFMDDP